MAQDHGPMTDADDYRADRPVADGGE